jgi:osmotically-inducible protein OsmY
MASFRRIGACRIGASLLLVGPVLTGLLSVGLLCIGLAGCSPVGMAVGAGATVTNMAMEERGFVTSARDKVIWTDISGRLFKKNEKLFQDVDVQVHEGRVLLSGFVQKPEDRVEATRIAWEPDGIREVVNEIKLGRSLDFGDVSQDVWLIQQVRLKLMFDRDVRAINYSVDCIRSTVYLMGIARTPAELQRVIDHVRDVPYVRAVVNHVRVRTDPLPPIPETPPTIAEPVPAPNGLPKYTPPASGRQKPAQQATR